MQKIMFNDRYGLTDAVIEGRKIMTRRLIPDEFFGLTWDTRGNTLVYENEYGDFIDVRHSKYTRYKLGEVVAVSQSYYHAFSPRCDIPVYGADRTPGWRNKLFVRADLMPHQIRITGIKCEQWFIAEEAKAWVNQGLYAPIGSFEKCLLEHRVGIPARKATVEEIIEHFKKREK